MIRHRRKSRYDAESEDEDPIDIIPLIDVMFLLLCFFIFITLAMVVQEGVDVSLAQAKSSQSVQEKDPMVISVDESGSLFFNKEKMTEKQLKSTLASRANKQSDRPVFINADEDARHKRVMLALDTVRQAGLKNVTFIVKPGK